MCVCNVNLDHHQDFRERSEDCFVLPGVRRDRPFTDLMTHRKHSHSQRGCLLLQFKSRSVLTKSAQKLGRQLCLCSLANPHTLHTSGEHSSVTLRPLLPRTSLSSSLKNLCIQAEATLQSKKHPCYGMPNKNLYIFRPRCDATEGTSETLAIKQVSHQNQDC